MEAVIIPAFLIAGFWIAWKVMIRINYYTFGERQEMEQKLAERKEARQAMRDEAKGDDHGDTD